MVDVLTSLHAALVPGGALVDTQPVGPRWPVGLGARPLGELDTTEWVEIVAAVDAELEKTLAAGPFELLHEERYPVVHEFSSGAECLEEVASWAGTHVPGEIATRLQHGSGRATVEHDVRLRLLAAV